MDNKKLNQIFLSASIPDVNRNKKFYNTADIIAIRDCIIALASVVIPKAQLVWGGHPSITPLIKIVLDKMEINYYQHVKLYQSLWFKSEFPIENKSIHNVIYTESSSDIKKSIDLMREEMISKNHFKAAVFIGGMEGIEEEYEMFKLHHPNALIFPISTTGGASKILFSKIQNLDKRLETDYAYFNLFNSLFNNILLS